MHLANRTASRVGFLRELSVIVLGFSECDVLELELYGDVRYRWQARRWPAESFAFDPGGSDQAGSDRSIKSLVEQSAREVWAITQTDARASSRDKAPSGREAGRSSIKRVTLTRRATSMGQWTWFR